MVHTNVDATIWERIGENMRQGGPSRLDELALALSDDSAEGTFGDLEASARQSVHAALEAAFCDPHGRLAALAALPPLAQLRSESAFQEYAAQVRSAAADSATPGPAADEAESALAELRAKVDSFASLEAVNWPLPPQYVEAGEPGAAVAAVQDRYKDSPVPASGAAETEASDTGVLGDTDPEFLIGYRDYLRDLWVDGANAYDTRLAERFHQDFHTASLQRRPANEILIPIVIRALVAPTGPGHGRGIDPATIPARSPGQPARAYLDQLILLSKLSGTELALRYRIDLSRPDSALSSEVEENIATIRGFFADDFQSVDPNSIFESAFQGAAPFYLQYEEWVRQYATFVPENQYQVTWCVPAGTGVNPDRAQRLLDLPQAKQLPEDRYRSWRLYVNYYLMLWTFQEGCKAFGRLEYQQARSLIERARFLTSHDKESRDAALEARKQLKVDTWADLRDFQNRAVYYTYLDYPIPQDRVDEDDNKVFEFWAGDRSTPDTDIRKHRAEVIARIELIAIPSLLGDIAVALNDYAEALRQYARPFMYPDTLDRISLISTATLETTGVYRGFGDYPYSFKKFREPQASAPMLFHHGSVPYTTLPSRRTPQEALHPVDVAYFELRQISAILEWADQLYRSDVPDAVARARELYKAALFRHGERPPTLPSWDAPPPRFRRAAENPARTAQIQHARLCLHQIAAGLNYFGYGQDVVPLLRYRTLADAAREHARQAKSAESDLLRAMGRIEDLIVDEMQLLNLRHKALLQTAVAAEQTRIAGNNAQIAAIQVQQVNDLIAAKRKEIEDHDSFLGQLGDFIGNIKDMALGLPEDTKSATAAGYMSEVTGKELVGTGMLGAGASGSIMAGFGIATVVSVISLNSMTNEANGRRAALNALTQQTLPMAQAQLDSRQREQVIVALQNQIAQADATLAASLLAFHSERALNIDFWVACAQVSRRILRRYLELGSRTAWLAERALAYEQDRALRLIKLDYFPGDTAGVTGADQLQLDLSELEAVRLAGLGHTVPVKHTYSLARDFPLRFTELKATGRCTFRTEETPLRLAYPGTYGYRIRAVTVTVSDEALRGQPRGILRNLGMSTISTADPNVTHASVRPPDALPVSEFRLRADKDVFGLPDESLLTFEGSGVDTVWELELPSAANPQGLAGLVDVMLTIDARAHYSAAVTPPASAPARGGLALASARQLDPEEFQKLTDAGSPVKLKFPAHALRLPAVSSAKIANVLLVLCGPDTTPLKAVLRAEKSDRDISLTFESNSARSNGPPLHGGTPSPLNALIGSSPDQTFTLTLNRLLGPNLSKIRDIVLGIEYTT